jgi:hypothetical protein
VDFCYTVTEKALEQNGYLWIIFERIKLIEQMHLQSPAMQGQLAAIQATLLSIPSLLKKELVQINATKEAMVAGAVQATSIFN